MLRKHFEVKTGVMSADPVPLQRDEAAEQAGDLEA